MVRGHPCPHQRRHCIAFRDGRTVIGVFQSVCLSDRSGRRPEVRQGGQRHGPRASLPASKVSLQHLPRRTGRDWRVPVGSVRLTDLAGHRKYAIAPSVMVRGHPCPHQRCHCSASRDGRTIQVCSSRFGWPDGHRKFASAETVMVGGHPWVRRRPRRQGFPNSMRVRPPTPEPLPTDATG